MMKGWVKKIVNVVHVRTWLVQTKSATISYRSIYSELLLSTFCFLVVCLILSFLPTVNFFFICKYFQLRRKDRESLLPTIASSSKFPSLFPFRLTLVPLLSFVIYPFTSISILLLVRNVKFVSSMASDSAMNS